MINYYIYRNTPIPRCYREHSTVHREKTLTMKFLSDSGAQSKQQQQSDKRKNL